MIGSLIGAGMKIGGAIIGNIGASKAMKRAKAGIESQKKENQAWFDRKYNEDGLQRSSAQRVLSELNNSLSSANRRAAATAAVGGGTEESVAVQKEAAAKAAGDTMSQLAAAEDARKDSIETQYRAQDSALANQLTNMEINRANQVQQAGAQMGEAGGLIAENFNI